MNNRNKLAIFDLDGTLFDTKNVNFKAYSSALEECGIQTEIDYKYYCDFCNGNNYREFLPEIIPGISEETMQQIHNAKKSLYGKYLNCARKNEHLFCIMHMIREEYQTAVVTAASRRNTEEILRTFGEWGAFDFVITQEDVSKTKPNPECFIVAMQKAGVSHENTIIFEDSETGIGAAKASGADYIKVYGYN